MPLELTLKIEGLPKTSLECGRIAALFADANRLGMKHYWTACRFLLDASRMKKPRPQADRLVLCWAHFQAAKAHADCPENVATTFSPFAIEAIKKGLMVWIPDIENPAKLKLEKAKTRKQSHAASAKAVKELLDLRGVFERAGDVHGLKLQTDLFWEDWCLPALDRTLDYWRDQLAFVEQRMAEAED